jgi:nitrite reductase (NADH) small subunit
VLRDKERDTVDHPERLENASPGSELRAGIGHSGTLPLPRPLSNLNFKEDPMPFLNTTLKPQEVAVGASRCVPLEGTDVGLFRTAAGFFALNNICPHRGAPLHDGFVTDGQVTCPWHQWQFDLQDGHCRNIPGAKVSAYAVEVREGTIWINLDDKGAKKS